MALRTRVWFTVHVQIFFLIFFFFITLRAHEYTQSQYLITTV